MEETREVGNLYKSDTLVVAAANEQIDYAKSSRFVKVTDDEAGRVSALLQQLPSAMSESVLNGAYRVEFPVGVAGHLTRYKNGYIGTIKGLDDGKFVGQATLIPLDDYAVMASTFSTLSIVTSQYYLHQINQRLLDLQRNLNRVLEFLYDDKACEIYAEAKAINGLYMNYSSVMESPELRIASISTVQYAKNVAERNIQFYYRDMNKLVDAADAKKTERLGSNLRDDLGCYNQAINLYGICSILEITLSQNFDKAYLKYMEDDLKAHMDAHKMVIAKLEGKLAQLLRSADGILAKKNAPKLESLIAEVQELISPESQVGDFEPIIEDIANTYTNRTEYRVLADGTVYQKID